MNQVISERRLFTSDSNWHFATKEWYGALSIGGDSDVDRCFVKAPGGRVFQLSRDTPLRGPIQGPFLVSKFYQPVTSNTDAILSTRKVIGQPHEPALEIDLHPPDVDIRQIPTKRGSKRFTGVVSPTGSVTTLMEWPVYGRRIAVIALENTDGSVAATSVEFFGRVQYTNAKAMEASLGASATVAASNGQAIYHFEPDQVHFIALKATGSGADLAYVVEVFD